MYKFMCKKCHKNFSDENQLELHMSSYHTEVKNLKCGICKKEFDSIGKFNRHERTHQDTEFKECDVCQKKIRAPYFKKAFPNSSQ